MKKTIQYIDNPTKIILGLILAIITFTSCDDMLLSDSTRQTSVGQYQNSGTSIYSMAGVFTRLQKLADSYVLLGELRADLLDLGEKSDPSLVEINNLEITKDNKYVNIKDYYDVINNCNFIISRYDTTYLDKGVKLQLRQYGALKAIRAWTYMQLALNFKTAKYYTAPILTVDEAEMNYPVLEMKELADSLINDLASLQNITYPSLGLPNESYFDVRFVLGDLYLWRASLTGNSVDYENAATAYHKLIVAEGYALLYRSTWNVVNNVISNSATLGWKSTLNYNNSEAITYIYCPTQYGQKYSLGTLNSERSIVASQIAIDAWDNQIYYLNDASKTTGDLRKNGSLTYTYNSTTGFSLINDEYIIYKYEAYSQNVNIYRASLLYLRYAEAVNRLNKPNLAFAVLKYGLTNSNMINKKIIPLSESGQTLPKYMDFSSFTTNVGVRTRGCGELSKDTSVFVIPKGLNTMADSVRFVEDKIVEELGLETAFEGNRYHDLMRFAYRRIVNVEDGGSTFLSEKIAAKHTDNKEAIKTKLLTIDNWYIRYK
jgi:starch-binding outer membrane protein, SusD/RagB family